MIAIPESVAFRWGDPINRAALNVMGGSTEVPSDLSLPEAERFELAGLAARRVRVEHWMLMRALWAATWSEAVRTHLPSARLLSYGDHRAFMTSADESFADPSVAFSWENDGHCGVFAVPGRGHLFTALWLVEAAAELQAQFYLLDSDQGCHLSDGADLGSDWGDDGASRRETRAGLLPFVRTETGIDPAAATTVAGDAMAMLARMLP